MHLEGEKVPHGGWAAKSMKWLQHNLDIQNPHAMSHSKSMLSPLSRTSTSSHRIPKHCNSPANEEGLPGLPANRLSMEVLLPTMLDPPLLQCLANQQMRHQLLSAAVSSHRHLGDDAIPACYPSFHAHDLSPVLLNRHRSCHRLHASWHPYRQQRYQNYCATGAWMSGACPSRSRTGVLRSLGMAKGSCHCCSPHTAPCLCGWIHSGLTR